MRFDDGAWERQAALVKEQQALELRLANLCQANEDARTTGLEDN
jgi:DNA primase